MGSAWRSVRLGLICATCPHPLWGFLESPSEVSQVVQLPCPTLGVVGGFFHTDHSDQAHLSQNGDILLKCTLQTYSCSPASFQAKRKCQQVTRKVLRIKAHHKQHPSAAKASLLFCDRGASLCNPGLLAGDVKIQWIKSVVPSDGPNPSQSEGGHLEGTQAVGEWIPQDSQGMAKSPTTTGGCNLPGGRFIWWHPPSKSPLWPFLSQKLCPLSHQSGCPPKKRTVPSPPPLDENPLASLWGSQRVESIWHTPGSSEVQICGQVGWDPEPYQRRAATRNPLLCCPW